MTLVAVMARPTSTAAAATVAGKGSGSGGGGVDGHAVVTPLCGRGGGGGGGVPDGSVDLSRRRLVAAAASTAVDARRGCQGPLPWVSRR